MTDQDFKDTVLVSLARLEQAMGQNGEEHKEMLPLVQKIPLLELGLNNHLRTHSNITNYVGYPIMVAFILGLMGTLAKLVLHAF